MRKPDNGPLKLEVQLQPSIVGPKPYPVKSPYAPENIQVGTVSSTDIPATIKPTIDSTISPANHPTYSPYRENNVQGFDPQAANAVLAQQYFGLQNPGYGFRQNSDGTVVSTYNQGTTSRPPFFNWFGTNNNNNYQTEQQQGPILGFLTNLAQNNPITSFFNGFQNQQSDQQTNPFQNFFTNLNPFNIFNNNNNRPQQVTVTLPVQADYISAVSPPSSILVSNLDNSAFNNDHFLNPLTQGAGSPFNPGYQNSNYMQSVNFNPGFSNPTQVFNPSYSSSYHNPYTTTHIPSQYITQSSHQPYSQLLYNRNPSTYPVYHNPYQTTSPISIALNPYNRKKNNGKKKKNKNKVDVPETDSDWFHDFLDRRKEASLDVSSRKPAKKNSEEENDSDFDDYFR